MPRNGSSLRFQGRQRHFSNAKKSQAPFGVLSSILVGEETLNAAMAVGFVLIFLAVLCSETKFAFLRRGKKGVDSPAPDGYNNSQANTLQTCDGEK